MNDKNKLGQSGHIGIDSPRKIISNLYSGGRLFINIDVKNIKKDFPRHVPTKIQIIKNKIKK